MGAGLHKGLGVAGAQALSGKGAVIGDAGGGVRQVGTKGAPGRGERRAHHGRDMALGHGHAAVAGQHVGEAVLPGRLREHRRGIGKVAHHARREAVAVLPLAQRQRYGCVGHGKAAHGAIGLGDADLQVATVARGIEVVDDEGAGRHRGFVELDTVLRDGDTGIGVGHAAHHGRVAALGVGQHAVVTVQAYAAKRGGVHQVASRVGVAQYELGRPVGNVALCVGGDVLVAAPSSVRPAEGAVVPEMPAVDVDAAVQAQVALRGVFGVAGAPVVGVELVAEQADRHAGAPLVGTDIAAHRTA